MSDQTLRDAVRAYATEQTTGNLIGLVSEARRCGLTLQFTPTGEAVLSPPPIGTRMLQLELATDGGTVHWDSGPTLGFTSMRLGEAPIIVGRIQADISSFDALARVVMVILEQHPGEILFRLRVPRPVELAEAEARAARTDEVSREEADGD